MSRFRLALASLALLAVASPTLAAEGRPFQLALVNPVQIVPEGESISGVRLTLIYTKNRDVTGLDLSFIAAHATGNFTGVQWALVGLADGNLLGWQANAINLTGKTMRGLQSGLFNKAGRVEGLQFGLVNVAGTINGLQIGLVNVIQQGGWLPVMVLVNGHFD